MYKYRTLSFSGHYQSCHARIIQHPCHLTLHQVSDILPDLRKVILDSFRIDLPDNRQRRKRGGGIFRVSCQSRMECLQLHFPTGVIGDDADKLSGGEGGDGGGSHRGLPLVGFADGGIRAVDGDAGSVLPDLWEPVADPAGGLPAYLSAEQVALKTVTGEGPGWRCATSDAQNLFFREPEEGESDMAFSV